MRIAPLALASGLAFLTSLAPAHAQNAQLTVAQAVANVQQFYNGVQTFTSPFTQQYLVSALHTTVQSDGTVSFAKPGLMNWAYLHPPGNRVLVRGQQVWAYQASTGQQVQFQAQTPAALAFLGGQGQFASSFSFTMPSNMPFQGGYVLVGTPTVPTAAFNTAIFYVDAQTSQIRRVTLVDGQRNTNTFTFGSPTVNAQLPARTFVP